MNEVQLSNDLNVITAEIKVLEHSLKNHMIEHSWQIGKRLVHVKEGLEHGNFGEWIEENFEFTWQYANKFMKFFKEFPNYSLSSNLPSWNHAVEILYLPKEVDRQDFIEKPHTIPSTNETKTVDKMTVKELKEVKAALKRAEEQVKVARNSEAIALQQLENMEDPEPIIREKIVIPKKTKDEMKKLKSELSKTEDEITRLNGEIEKLRSINDYNNEKEERDKELELLRYQADKEIFTLKLQIEEFLRDVAFTAFKKGAIANADEVVRERLFQGLEELKDFCRELELALNGRKEILYRGEIS